MNIFDNLLEQVRQIGLFYYVLSQLLAALAVTAFAIAPHRPAMQSKRRVNLAGAVVNLVGFWLLDAWGGFIAMLVYGTGTATMLWLVAKRPADERSIKITGVKCFFLLTAFGVGLWQCRMPIDLLATAANTIGMAAMLLTGRRTARLVNWLFLVVGILWFIYNAWIGSLFALIGQVGLLTSIVVALARPSGKIE